MADGDYVVSYQEVRDECNLESDTLPDTVLDRKISRAQNEVARLLYTAFHENTQPSFSAITLNSRDVGKGNKLYLSDFGYGKIVSISSLEYRSDEDGSWTTLTEGMNDDFSIDYDNDAIHFRTSVISDGYDNLRLTGTYGYLYADIPDHIKQLVSLLAALQCVIYSSGGSYENVDSHTVGNITVTRSQRSSSLKQEYENLVGEVEIHMKAAGLRLERTRVDLI